MLITVIIFSALPAELHHE